MADSIASSSSTPGGESVVVGFGWRTTAVTRDILARLGLLGHILKLRNYRLDRRRAKRAKQVVPPIIAAIPLGTNTKESATWRMNRVISTVSDVLVVKAGPAERPSEAVIKIAETPTAADGLRWQLEALTTLEGDTRLGDWRELLPKILDSGEVERSPYLVETRVTGVNLEQALHDPDNGDSAVGAAAQAIGHLHAKTAEAVPIGRDHLDRWVRKPIRVLVAATDRAQGHRSTATEFERLSTMLCAALEGQPITVGWTHGDYGPGNILMGPDREVTGIIDWEFAQPADFPSLDIVTLLLTVRMYVHGQELGRVVRDLLGSPHWGETESARVAAAPDAATWLAIGIDRVILLCWLRHTASMIERCSRYGTSGLWLHTNIHSVLDALRDRH